jgi:hypothetical protein
MFWVRAEAEFHLPLGLLLWYPNFMAMSIRGTPKKKRGRPPTTGRGTQVGMRWQDQDLAAIDEWAGQNGAKTRPEAIRRLVEIGLSKSEPPQRPKVLSTAKQSAARAAELAAKTIDIHIDQEAHPDEREVRKRKLIQGPSVFRDARKDR